MIKILDIKKKRTVPDTQLSTAPDVTVQGTRKTRARTTEIFHEINESEIHEINETAIHEINETVNGTIVRARTQVGMI